MTVVRIPPVLREAAGGTKQVDLEGATVGEILVQLVERFPALRDQLFTADDELNRFVNVYLNSEDVRYLSELATPAGPRDTLVVLPAMAGGGGRGPNAPPPRQIPTPGVSSNDERTQSDHPSVAHWATSADERGSRAQTGLRSIGRASDPSSHPPGE